MGNTQWASMAAAAVRAGLLATSFAGTAAESMAQAKELTSEDFDTRMPPRGTVRDSAGKPIAGAVVRFRIEDSVHWRNHVLRRQPLPRVQTSRDGEFFLPLTGQHRLFTRQTAGQISLVVEKPGYHPWIEPLPMGLRGYLGSAVVLRAVTARDQIEIKVRNSLPGMRLRVHRFATKAVPHLELERWYEVPESGVVKVAMSFVPTPFTLGTLNNMALPIGIEVQVIHPERSTVPVKIEFGQRRLEIGGADGKLLSAEKICSIGRSDGKPLVAPRGLYRCPDGRARWFPVNPGQVMECPLQVDLIAIVDEGCLAINVPYIDPSREKILLEPIPTAGQRVLELRDKRGALVDKALVSFFDLAGMPGGMDGNKLGHARARRRLSCVEGRVDLGSLRLPGPGFLFVHAPGFAPAIYFDPRQIVGVAQLNLGGRVRYGKIQLTVVDEDEVPVRGAQVVMNKNSFELGAFNKGPLRTDRSGRVTIDLLKIGRHSVQVLGNGLSQALVSIQVSRAGQVVRKPLILSRSQPYRVVLMDGEGRPVPFAPVRIYANASGIRGPNIGLVRSQLRTNPSVCADSRGRILLLDYPKSMQPRVMDMFSLVRQQAMLDEAETIHKVELGGYQSVSMPLPRQAVVQQECLTVNARTTTRTVPRSHGCSLLLVRFPMAVPEAVLSVYMAGIAPMRLTLEMIEAAEKLQTERPILIDQRKITRTASFAVSGLGEVAVEELRLELPGINFRGGQPYLYGDSGLRLHRADSGNWQVGLRDTSAFSGWILHPEFLLQTVEVPGSEEAGEKPVEVEMTRGCAVVFRVSSKTPLLPTSKAYVYVHTMNNRMALYQYTELGLLGKRIGKNQWEVKAPFAIDPGQYRLTLRVVGTAVNMPRRTFTAVAGEALVVEITDRVAKQISSGGEEKKLPDNR